MSSIITITEPYYATAEVEKTVGNPPIISSVKGVAVMFEGAKLDITELVLRDPKVFNRFADRVMREYEKVRGVQG